MDLVDLEKQHQRKEKNVRDTAGTVVTEQSSNDRNALFRWFYAFKSGNVVATPTWNDQQQPQHQPQQQQQQQQQQEFRQRMMEFLEAWRQQHQHQHPQQYTAGGEVQRTQPDSDLESTSSQRSEWFSDERSDADRTSSSVADDVAYSQAFDHYYYDRCNIWFGWAILLFICIFVVMSVVVIASRDGIVQWEFWNVDSSTSNAPSQSPSYYYDSPSSYSVAPTSEP